MTAWLLTLITIGAIIRVTRLVTADYITAPIRERLSARWGQDSQRAYLINCDYCASVYVAAIISTISVYWGDNRIVIIALIALTASYATGFIAGKE